MTEDRYRALDSQELRLYLDRIGFEGAPEAADIDGVAAVHHAHFYTFPFENLDIHLGDPVLIHTDWLVEKMLVQRRGGFCYELNLLLRAALRGMGFDVAPISGQMERKRGFGPPFDHLALLVRLPGGNLLADAGNGETFQRPLPLDGSWVKQYRGGEYRAVLSGIKGHVDFRPTPDAPATTKYLFDPTPRDPDEFLGMVQYHATSPESRFTKGWIATLPRERDSRITVSRGMLMETIHGTMERRALESPDDLGRILQDEFRMAPFAVPQSWFRRA